MATIQVDGKEHVVDEGTAFFYEHAGWSYQPEKETSDQGKLRGAQELAEAELHARRENWTIGWEDDWSLGMTHEAFYGEAYSDGEPDTCETATLYDAEGNVLASLGCIDGATTEYRRVVAAELAEEARQS